MMPVLQVGPLALPLPALLILLGIWLGLTLAERYTTRHSIQANQLFNLVLTGLVTGVIGARLAYVIRYPQAFVGNPLDIFSRNLGLFDPLAGTVVGILAAAIYAQRKHLPWLSMLDSLTPGLAVFALALSLSHLASGQAFGAPSDLPWSLELWGARRHPSQIYEAILASMILVFLWPGRKFVMNLKTGTYFLYFMTLTSAGALFLEAFRGDSNLLLGGLRTAQLIYWILLGICLYAIDRIKPHTDHI